MKWIEVKSIWSFCMLYSFCEYDLGVVSIVVYYILKLYV